MLVCVCARHMPVVLVYASLFMCLIVLASRRIPSRDAAPPSTWTRAGRTSLLPPSLPPTCMVTSQPLPSPHLNVECTSVNYDKIMPAMHPFILPPPHSPPPPPPPLTLSSSSNSLGRLPHPLHPRGLGLCHLGPDLHHGGRLRRLSAHSLSPRHQGAFTLPSLPPSFPPRFNHIHCLRSPSLPSLPPSPSQPHSLHPSTSPTLPPSPFQPHSSTHSRLSLFLSPCRPSKRASDPGGS